MRWATQAPPTRANTPTNCASAIRSRSTARLRRKTSAPRSCFILATSSTTLAKRNITTTNSMILFRNYPAPIFAIPGNHDSFVIPGTAAGHTPLDTFQRNFCAKEHVITPEAGSLHRTAMTQPGVYFSLDAPFVRIIGLFSNALEDPGVISNLDNKWSAVSNIQIDFLRAQLQRIKQEKYASAVLIAVHPPP